MNGMPTLPNIVLPNLSAFAQGPTAVVTEVRSSLGNTVNNIKASAEGAGLPPLPGGFPSQLPGGTTLKTPTPLGTPSRTAALMTESRYGISAPVGTGLIVQAVSAQGLRGSL